MWGMMKAHTFGHCWHTEAWTTKLEREKIAKGADPTLEHKGECYIPAVM